MMIDSLISKLKQWASGEPAIKAIALVGSHARGAARADSDIDIVMICTKPSIYLKNHDWLCTFGTLVSAEQEDWGLVQSWRVHYEDNTEIEFGLTTGEWCTEASINSGTGRVIADGAKIVYDPHSLLKVLIKDVADWKFAHEGQA